MSGRVGSDRVPPVRLREPHGTVGSVSSGGALDVSVIVPVAERPEELVPLYREYAGPLRDSELTFEFLFTVPKWGRALAEPLDELVADGEPIRILEVGGSVTEASLLRAAGSVARGEVFVTLPAYYRVEPQALPTMVERVHEGVDLVLARRWPRRDPWVNRLQTRLFHRLLGWLSGISEGFHDVGSGVRAMRAGLLDDVPLYGDFTRFLPVLAAQQGFDVEEVTAAQHPRDAGARVYGPGVYLRRILDVLGVLFLVRFTYKPLRFFGLIGSAFSLAGAVILLILFVQRLTGQALADRPMLLLGILAVTFGVQAVALGLVGEMIVHLHAPQNRSYRLRRDDVDGDDEVGEEGAREREEEHRSAERARSSGTAVVGTSHDR